MFGRFPQISLMMAALAAAGPAIISSTKATLPTVDHDYRRIERDLGRLRRRTDPLPFTPNGKREAARRRRQIAAGSLREANGLHRGGVG